MKNGNIVDAVGRVMEPPAPEATEAPPVADAPDMVMLNGRVLVRPDVMPDKVGAIYVQKPDGVRSSSGVVLASGSALCELGDRVFYYGFNVIDEGISAHYVVEEKNLVAVKRKASA